MKITLTYEAGGVERSHTINVPGNLSNHDYVLTTAQVDQSKAYEDEDKDKEKPIHLMTITLNLAAKA